MAWLQTSAPPRGELWQRPPPQARTAPHRVDLRVEVGGRSPQKRSSDGAQRGATEPRHFAFGSHKGPFTWPGPSLNGAHSTHGSHKYMRQVLGGRPEMIMPDLSAMAHPMLPALQLELRASRRARSMPQARLCFDGMQPSQLSCNHFQEASHTRHSRAAGPV